MGFSEQLKRARKRMGFTQQQVADAMGITKSTYCCYETGKRQPDVIKIKRLAAILNTSGDILLETGFERDYQAGELYGMFLRLTDENKHYLYGYLHRLLEEQQNKEGKPK